MPRYCKVPRGIKNQRIMAVVHWNSDRVRQAYRMALLGLKDEEMASVMGITLPTFNAWKRDKVRFRKAIKRGKDEADSHVALSLYKRAVGYHYVEDHITVYKGEVIVTPLRKYMHGDVQAQTKWLQARQRGRWTEVQRHEITNNTLNIIKMDLENGLTMEEKMMLRKIQLKQLAQNAGGN